MDYKILKGESYFCKQNYINDDDEVCFYKNRTYVSLDDNTLCSEIFPMHKMNGAEDFFEHFQKVEIIENKAMRFNSDKPQFSLLNLDCFTDTVKVLEFGAMKYARDNWQKGLVFSEVLDSMMRHIKGLQNGEWLDPESGKPHIGHIGCNAMFLGSKTNTMDLEKLKKEFEEWKQQKS